MLDIIRGILNTTNYAKRDKYYENRPAYRLPKFTYSTVLDKTYQDDFEQFLSDQVPFSSKMKVASKTLSLGTKLFYANMNNSTYNNLGNGMYYINKNIVYTPMTLSDAINSLENKIDNYNEIIKDYKTT